MGLRRMRKILRKSRFGKFIRFVKNTLSHSWYWFRCHTYTRYHIVDFRSKKNGYSWGWMDRVDVLLYASFEILKEFVEKENPNLGNFIPHDSEDEAFKVSHDTWNAANAEILRLYEWWTKGRVESQKLYDELWKTFDVKLEKDGFFCSDENAYGRWTTMGDELEETDQSNLESLMRVRKFMWT